MLYGCKKTITGKLVWPALKIYWLRNLYWLEKEKMKRWYIWKLDELTSEKANPRRLEILIHCTKCSELLSISNEINNGLNNTNLTEKLVILFICDEKCQV